ncbi:MAG TPA: citrate/2-methylcitrate synthase [Streptosporangiaceae bacterium]
MTEWIGAAEAAERLGIKQASLYAYVSRGVLSRRRDPDGRASMFDSHEVEQLARKGRPRRTGGPAELVIETAVTEIRDSTLRYRGHDATDLAMRCSFEDVAMLLWTGELPAGESDGTATGWRATAEALAVGRAAQAALPDGTFPLERLQVIVPALAATDPFRLHLDRPAVVAAGQALIAGMTGALPAASGTAIGEESDAAEAAPAGPVAARLAAALCLRPPPAGLIRVLNAALVLVADHELAASTLAARVAASMRADPYAVVATGLGAMGGALHGGAALGAELMLGAAQSGVDAPRVVGDLLRRGERLPGFGHFVYTSGDPRANLLLELIGDYAPGSPRLAIAMAVTAEARRRALPEPNIEFALAVLAQVAGMVRGAGEAIFATGRTAGWLAHALEEYERNIPIRPRGVYTGQSAI